MDYGWQRLGHRVASRRARFGWSVRELARRIDMSARTVEYIEAGSDGGYRPKPATIARLEAVLGWADGSCTRIREGGEPEETEDLMLARALDAWPSLNDDQRATVVALVESLTRQR